MSDELESALRIYPVVWVVGEPVATSLEARRVLERVTGTRPVFWTAAVGSTEVERPFAEATQVKVSASSDLLTALLQKPAVVILADGLRADPILMAAADAVVATDRRAVFVSSDDPPSEFLRDYLRVLHPKLEGLTKMVQDNCTANKVKFNDDFLGPLTGLRPFRATSTLLEGFLNSGDEPEELVEYLYSARRDSVFQDSDGVISMSEPEETFEGLIGLGRAKKLLMALCEKVGESPVRGALLLGIPGTGKTAIARATANEAERPLYIFDLGSVFGSLVGESERKVRRALQTLKALPPGVVLFDEIEKALSGSSQSSAKGDSGTASRVGGYVLQYLNEPSASEGFHLLLGTSNDVMSLPPEFTRAGRWDALFWFGLPGEEVLTDVLNLYREEHELPKTFGARADLKGMTPSEVEATCRIASILDTKVWNEAVEYVPVLSKFRAEDVNALEQWAAGRAVSANDTVDQSTTGGRRLRRG